LVCTVPNRGAVDGIEPGAGVEVVCHVDGTGPHPLPVGAIPLAFRGLVQAVKAYETLTVQAAVERKREVAVQALINHPLVGDMPTAEALVDEMLAAHGLEFD
jgi:6-phospho-beta-glucosidase